MTIGSTVRLVGLVSCLAMLSVACLGNDAGSGPIDTGLTTAPPADTQPVATEPDVTTTPEPAAPASIPVLSGTEWSVTLYTIGAGGLTNPWPGTQITIRFGEDGTLSGSGGCNEYGGTYSLSGLYDEFEDGIRDPYDGQTIEFGQIAATEIGCTEPNGIMEQEGEYLTLLGDVGRWVLIRGNLALRTSDGFALIEAEPLG